MKKRRRSGGDDETIQVLLVDDHALVREGLRHILEECGGIRVSGEAATGEEAVERLKSIPCNLVIMDISMPGRGGLDAIKAIHAIEPGTPVLVLSMHPEEQYALRALRAGASGYIMKEKPTADLIAAVRKVASGGTYVTTSLAEALANSVGPGGTSGLHEALSNREDQVLRLIAAGKSLKVIALEFRLSVKTISTYRRRLLRKMKMKTTAEIVRYAVENHLH